MRVDDKVRAIPIEKIRAETDVQPRKGIDEETVERYREVIAALPPGVVYLDGDGVFWLASGFQRLEAHKRAKRTLMQCEIRNGTKRDAKLFARSHDANPHDKVGRPLTRLEKRQAVADVIDMEPGWADNRIAEWVGVGQHTVERVREELSQRLSCTPEEKERLNPEVREGKDGKKRKARKSRKRVSRRPEPDAKPRAKNEPTPKATAQSKPNYGRVVCEKCGNDWPADDPVCEVCPAEPGDVEEWCEADVLTEVTNLVMRIIDEWQGESLQPLADELDTQTDYVRSLVEKNRVRRTGT